MPIRSLPRKALNMVTRVTLELKEDIKFLDLILKELQIQVDRDISVFSYDKEVNYTELVKVDDSGEEIGERHMGKATTMSIYWRPGGDKNHPFKHIDKVQINWRPVDGAIELELRHYTKASGRSEQWNVTYPVGYDKGFFTTKMAFYGIYKKVVVYQDVEIPRRNRENLINAVCEAFPSILDDLILGDHGEKT